MLLTRLGVSVRYRRIRNVLQTGDNGTPFFNLEFLSKLGVSVTVKYEYADPLGILEAYLAQGLPVIASVTTSYLPYWSEHAYHAVVIAGFEDKAVSVYDPWFPDAPQVLEWRYFDSAWLDSTYLHAVIHKPS